MQQVRSPFSGESASREQPSIGLDRLSAATDTEALEALRMLRCVR
jgi:hypothetical protein